MDKITEQRIGRLHPHVRDEVTKIINECDAVFGGKAIVRIAQGLRTFAEQDALYAQGRTKPGRKVTNAKGGQSIHNYGLAVDIVLLVDKDDNGTYETASWDTQKDWNKDGMPDWMQCVLIFKKYGWSWGGEWKSFKDLPHFEKTFGYGWRGLLALKRDKNNYVMI